MSSIVGWSIPSIIGCIKAKRQQKRVHQYHTQINYLYADGELDQNDIGSLNKLKGGGITDAYAKGKITEQQYVDSKSEISLLYEEIYDKKISSLSIALGKNDDKSLDNMRNDITDAYAKGRIIETHYNILKEKIKAANDDNKRNKDVQAVKRSPL